MAVLRHVGCGLCFRTAAVLTLVSIALAVVMILYTDMRLRSRLDDIANTNTKPENQREAETSVQTLVERMQAQLEAGNLKGVRREALRMKATAAQLENRRLIRLSDRLAAHAGQLADAKSRWVK